MVRTRPPDPTRPAVRSRSRGRALAVLLLGLALLASPVPASAQGAPTRPDVSDTRRAVEQLRAQVEAVGQELADAAAAFEQGQDRLDELRQQEYLSGLNVEDRQARAREVQQRLDALARAAYRQQTRPTTSAWLRGDLQALGDYHFLQGRLGDIADGHESDLATLTAQKQTAQAAEEQRRADREAAQDLQARLDTELADLQQLALDRQAQLQEAADRLARAEAAEAAAAARAAAARDAAARAARDQARQVAAGRLPDSAVLQPTNGSAPGAACTGPAGPGVVNGFLPPDVLCPLSASGHRLEFTVAGPFEAMSRAYAAQFGRPMCVTDSYRDYAGQVDVFRRKPALAATPGRSQHGWGRAVDLCGGVQVFGSEPHRWMKANAAAFGFEHPAWAQVGGSRPEPWHWEFTR